MKSPKIKVLLGILVLGGASAWYIYRDPVASAISSSTAKAPKARGADLPITVNVVPAAKQDVPIELQASGTVVPINTVEIHPQISSLLKGVNIKEGQFVRAGELLFTLDDRNDRANLDKANAQLARDQASLSDLDRQYKRSQELVAQKFISQGASDTLQMQLEAQLALIKSDQAAVQIARIAVGYATIHAPMAGRVGAINVASGSLVQPGNTLATLTQINPISVSFSVPESSLQSLQEAKKRGSISVTATRSTPDRTLHGKLSFIDNAVDPVAGTIRVKAQFDNSDSALWPGQYVNTKITVDTLKNAIVVPLSAVVTSTNGKFVYSMEVDQTAKSRPIGLLYAFGTSAAVSGLSGEEKIIVEGKQNLRSGSKVVQAHATNVAKNMVDRQHKKQRRSCE